MKRGTPDHPKVADLCRLLNIGKAEAVGTLELLWHFTAKFAPQGDVGRFSDEAIAKAVAWEHRSGSAGVRTEVRLSSALVQSGFLDRCPTHRLLVHDWKDHADQSVMKHLSRHRLDIYGNCPDKNSLPLPLPLPLPEPIVPTPQAAAIRKRVSPVKSDPERDAWFAEWYSIYPRHIDPDGAKKRFLEFVKTREACDLAIEAVKQGKGGIADASAKNFIPYPAKWLKRTPWKDDIPEPAQQSLLGDTMRPAPDRQCEIDSMNAQYEALKAKGLV